MDPGKAEINTTNSRRPRPWARRLLIVAVTAIALLGFLGGIISYGYYADRPYFWLGRAICVYAWMPPVDYQPPSDRWQNLPRTHEILTHGGVLRVVMLGDSIMKDTSRSAWDLEFDRENPKVTIEKFTSVNHRTGCGSYREPGNVEKYVLDHRPDLVIIGGISNGAADNVRAVVEQIRARSQADILLMTGAFGERCDPTHGKDWRNEHPDDIAYARQLAEVADDMHCGFLDLQAAWGEYVLAAGEPLDYWKRDAVHASAAGEQIMGHILIRYLTP